MKTPGASSLLFLVEKVAVKIGIACTADGAVQGESKDVHFRRIHLAPHVRACGAAAANDNEDDAVVMIAAEILYKILKLSAIRLLMQGGEKDQPLGNRNNNHRGGKKKKKQGKNKISLPPAFSQRADDLLTQNPVTLRYTEPTDDMDEMMIGSPSELIYALKSFKDEGGVLQILVEPVAASSC